METLRCHWVLLMNQTQRMGHYHQSECIYFGAVQRSDIAFDALSDIRLVNSRELIQ